jgi:hypothetical protein
MKATKFLFLAAGVAVTSYAAPAPAQSGILCANAAARHIATKAALDSYCASRTNSQGVCNLQTRQGQQLTQNYIEAGIRRRAACG